MGLFRRIQPSGRAYVVGSVAASANDPGSAQIAERQQERRQPGHRTGGQTGQSLAGHGHLHHDESGLRRTLEPSRQFEETLPIAGHDVAGSPAHCRSDALLAGLPDGRETGPEDRSLFQTLRRAIIQPVALRFRSSCPQICFGNFIIIMINSTTFN